MENLKLALKKSCGPEGFMVLALVTALSLISYCYYKQSTLGNTPNDWKITCAGAVNGQTVLRASFMLTSMAVTKFTLDFNYDEKTISKIQTAVTEAILLVLPQALREDYGYE